MKLPTVLALLASTAALSTTAGYVLAQQNPGIRGKMIASADLGRHFESMQGKVLEMRRTEVDPHTSGGEHSHKGRPEVIFVLKGSVVEHQGPNAKEYKAGDAFASNADLNYPHRIENASDSLSEVLVIEVATREKK